MTRAARPTEGAGRRRTSTAVWLVALALPLGAHAQGDAPQPAPDQGPFTSPTGERPPVPVSPGQAESTADTLGTDGRIDTRGGDTPVSPGQAESVADPLGGVDDEGAAPLGQQPAGTGGRTDGQGFGEQGVLDLGQQPGRTDVGAEGGRGFGEQGVLDFGQQPRTGGTDVGAEGQDLPDADLGARGVDVEGTRVEPVFPDVNRAARGVEANQPGGIEQPLEDVDLQARGVRLQGEQVNEELLDVRAEGSRGIEGAEGPRAAQGEIPPRTVPGGGVLIIPGTGTGTGTVAPGAGQPAGAGLQAGQTAPGGAAGVTAAPEGAPAAGEGVAPVGAGLEQVVRTDLEEARELERVSVTGTVLAVSYSEAIARVSTDDQGILELRGRPQEIALLQPGDFVGLDVTEVGDAIWIAPATRFEPASADVTAAEGTGAFNRDLASPIWEDRGQVEGVITSVNPSEGLLIIGGRMFQAHPLEVRNLEPGQMVSVTYGTIADEDWAADIRVGGSADEGGASSP